MTVFDLIVYFFLLYAIWKGWSSGILVQLSGIAGIIAGAWVAYHFWRKVAVWLEVDPSYKEVLFVVILVAVLIIIIILCRLITRLLKTGGLSGPVKILGTVFSLAKMAIILALLLTAFEFINGDGRIVDPEYLYNSRCYKPLKNISEFIFPYLKQLTDSAGSIFN